MVLGTGEGEIGCEGILEAELELAGAVEEGVLLGKLPELFPPPPFGTTLAL